MGYVIIGLIGLLGIAQKADIDEVRKHSELLAFFFAWLQKYLWVLLPVLSGIAILAKATCDFIGEPWVKDAIHSTLSVISDVVFAGEDGVRSAYDRVTLFRRKGFHFCLRRWPWDGWMVPVVRSGHTSQRMATIFKAPDSPDKAEGVAGYCWAHQKVVEIDGLPQLTENSPQADLDSYSSATHMATAWLAENLPQARAYFAFPIKAKGKPWGVIVIDSQSRIIGARMRSITSIVGTMLSELVIRSGR